MMAGLPERLATHLGGLTMQENIQAIQEEQLDCEWLELILKAKSMGITIEEIKTFLEQC